MKTTVLGFDKADEPTDLETVAMTIDEGSVQHLMSTMTNLYSDSVLAVVREYSSNALDSHIRAGVNKPILITTPNENNHKFIVEDFGIGMSKDDIANIYSRYGLSTKNGTNSEIGAFGLGCKSALALADRFDLVARKDGIETVAFIQKNSKGVGVVHFVSETYTDQPNGVKVTIPVPMGNIYRFQSAIDNVFDTWAVGSALIDGQPNKAVQYGSEWLEIAPAGEPIAWFKMNKVSQFRTHSYYTNLFANTTFVIGGIAYTMERSKGADFPFDIPEYKTLGHMIEGTRIIMNLPIGSVDLTPSREQIMITDKTVKAIKSLIVDVTNNIRSTALNHLQGLTSAEAIRFYAANFPIVADEIDFSTISGSYGYRSNYRQHRPEFYGVKYQGKEIPTWVDVTGRNYFELNSIEGQALAEGNKVERVYTLNTLNAITHSNVEPNNILVVAPTFDDATLVSFRKNIRDYAKSKFGRTTVNGMLTNDTQVNEWVADTYEVVTFADFMNVARQYRSAKKSEAQTGTKRSAVAYAMTDLNPNSNTNGKIVKITADNITNEGADVIYVSADIDNLRNFPDPWTAVTDAMRSGDEQSYSSGRTSGFPERAYKAFGNKRVVFLNKGKSADAFAKKFPKATSYQNAILKAVKAVEKSGEGDVLAGVTSAVYSLTSGVRLGAFSENFITVAEQMVKNNELGNIKDAFIRKVFTSIGTSDKHLALASMFSDVKVETDNTLTNIQSGIVEYALSVRYSLINQLSVVSYYRRDTLTENDVKQVVALINAC